MRLQKYIAHAGIASRRKAEEMIKEGRVKVNDQVVKDMGVEIEPTKDKIYVDGNFIELEQKNVYIMLNKPKGYVTTVSDEFGRPTVLDLVKDINERIYPVGRLDFDTSGLLLLTNDGDFTYHLTHPKHEVKKTYIAKIKGVPTKEELKKFKNGVDIGGYITAPAHIEMIKQSRVFCTTRVMIHEGKNRQIRRMFDQINHPVVALKRVSIGEIKMNDLEEGKWRNLTKEEVNYLKNS
ncbi:pseudouridine synthase [Inediibacterium massiliense]|uniref:pseudouridine synthase n=1 Tax=Inediibacterium massiliense TaxID=1658111 RepID=UPI0006B4AF02|nr:pseudouridine synthase [Inediibacterium massiliense]